MAGPTYIDHSGQALVALVGHLAPIAEAAAEIIVEEIQAEIDASTPTGREYYIRRPPKEFRSEWRRNRREFLLAQKQAKSTGGALPKGPARTLKNRKYRASAEGQAPAKPTLRYRNSWHSTSASRKGSRITALAFSKAKTAKGESLAAALEFGTSRMAPRPHIRPALERARRRIAQLTRMASAA